MVSRLSASTRQKAARVRAAASHSASFTLTWPAASGRSWVRLTCASKLRSARSLMTQPAERISSVPRQKIQTIIHAGPAAGGDPQRPQRRPQQQQDADRLVQPHQPFVERESVA